MPWSFFSGSRPLRERSSATCVWDSGFRRFRAFWLQGVLRLWRLLGLLCGPGSALEIPEANKSDESPWSGPSLRLPASVEGFGEPPSGSPWQHMAAEACKLPRQRANGVIYEFHTLTMRCEALCGLKVTVSRTSNSRSRHSEISDIHSHLVLYGGVQPRVC